MNIYLITNKIIQESLENEYKYDDLWAQVKPINIPQVVKYTHILSIQLSLTSIFYLFFNYYIDIMLLHVIFV